MTGFGALALVAALQMAFIVLTVMLLFVTRMRGSRVRARGDDADLALAGPLQRVMLGDDRGESLAAALLRLRGDVAVREMISIGGTRLSTEQRMELAALVRNAPWVEKTLARASSRRWWKRMSAARLAVMVCDERDEKLIARLGTDRHAAVASASTAAIASCASPALVETIVSELHSRPPTVRLQQCLALRSHAELATDAVVPKLRLPATAPQLRAWVQLAETLATPSALAAVIPLATHPDVGVRTSVARALRSYFSADAADAVTILLRDQDWRVRAAAARAVGSLNVRDAIPLLSDSMHDESWWVRFRAGLALANLSREGRAALDDVRNSPDPFARDMATLICGLPDGSRLDLTAG